MNDFWNKRYSDKNYAYGKEPNKYFKKFIDKLSPGKILLPADGEGRNSVYAAERGWDVYAYDGSSEGQKKALLLAEEKNVKIEYKVSDVQDYKTNETFDVISTVFLHLPPDTRAGFHSTLPSLIRPGGEIHILGFSKKQIENNTGGPKNIDWLYSSEMLTRDFQDLKIIKCIEFEDPISEGPHHSGPAAMIEFIAVKQ